MTPQQVKELSEQFKPLNEQKFERRMQRLQNMLNWYTQHAKDGKDGGKLFNGFASALEYALTTMRMYRLLSIKLKDIADEIRTDSEG